MTSDRLLNNEQQASELEIKIYQKKVGSLIYASAVTRPDLSLAVSHLAEFMNNPSSEHQNAATQCLIYLYQSKDLSIEYAGSSPLSKLLNCSADAFFGNTESRNSIQGFVFKLGNGPIHWNSSKQTTVTTSTTEAELLALSHATKELMWINRLLNGIQLKTNEEIEIYNDNRKTIRLLNKEEPIIETKLRHVDIYQHWLRQRVQAKQIKVSWVSTNEMIADGMTKSLGRQKHEKFIKLLNLTKIESH